MRRREFIAGLGSTAACPIMARAQQVRPVIGFLHEGEPDTAHDFIAAFHRGLSEASYVEGQNVSVEYRWANEELDRLPSLASDLVRRGVNVIVALTTPAALAAKAATKTIPIVFSSGADPVEIGLVDSLSRPGGNITGISNLNVTVAGKRLELLRELLPAATSIAYLVNPTNMAYAEAETRELQAVANILRVQLLILNASDPSAFEAAYAACVHEAARGLVVGGDSLFFTHYKQLVSLAARFGVPTMYRSRESVVAGGLMSYATDLLDAFRQASVYAGRILMGAKAGDLPVGQVTKMQLAINMQTAKLLGLTFPLSLLGRADEVIE